MYAFCAAMHTSCGSSTVPWKSSLDTLYIMRQHICLWIMHSSLTVDSEYSTWHETIHLWLTMSYLDNLQYWWQADCSNACTMCINNSGLAVDCGQFLTAVNLQKACSELSGRSFVAVYMAAVSLIDWISDILHQWCTDLHSPINCLHHGNIVMQCTAKARLC